MSAIKLNNYQEFLQFQQMCNTDRQFFDFKVLKNNGFEVVASTEYLKSKDYL